MPRYRVTRSILWAALIPLGAVLVQAFMSLRGLGAVATVHAQETYSNASDRCRKSQAVHHLLLLLGEIAGIYEGADFVGHGSLRVPEPVNNWLVNRATRIPRG